MRAPVALLVSGVFACASDLAPETLLLQRARVVMSTNLARLPNYTCLQTIERFERPAPNKKPRLLDVIRLEVALVEGKEMFAWPGSNQFSDKYIGDMVKGGAIGNGGFALHAKAVFQTNVPRFTYTGPVTSDGRKLHQWNYVVPQLLSGYVIRVGPRQATVGYHGSFVADASTLDLVRLEVEADNIPPELGVAAAGMAVDYSRVDIAGERFLLPSRWNLQLTDFNGSVSSNQTTFTRCRHYSGESKLFFDDPEPGELNEPGLVRVIDAPRDLLLPVELETTMRFENAAVGDPVTAKLTKAIKLADGTVLPKQALVHGRLMLLRQQTYIRDPGRAVGISFFEAEAPGMRVRFSATLEEIQTAYPGFRTRWGNAPLRVENEALTGSVFFVPSRHLQLPRGLRMLWRTKPLATEDTQ